MILQYRIVSCLSVIEYVPNISRYDTGHSLLVADISWKVRHLNCTF